MLVAAVFRIITVFCIFRDQFSDPSWSGDQNACKLYLRETLHSHHKCRQKSPLPQRGSKESEAAARERAMLTLQRSLISDGEESLDFEHDATKSGADERLLLKAVCEGQAGLDRLESLADEIACTEAYDATAALLCQWRGRVMDLTADVRRKLVQAHAVALHERKRPETPGPQDPTGGAEHAVSDPPHYGLGEGRKLKLQQSFIKALRVEGRNRIADALENARAGRPPQAGGSPPAQPSFGSPGAEAGRPSKVRRSGGHFRVHAAPDAAAGGGAAGQATCSTLLTAAVYLSLESLVVSAGAEKAVLFKHIAAKNELQAIATVGHGLPSLGQLRLPPTAGLVGSVFTYNVAVNATSSHFAHETIGFKCGNVSSVLSLPIPGVDAGHARSCGVLVLLNKYRGLSPFHAGDESQLSSSLGTLSHLIQRYPLEFGAFDPAPFHAIVPFRPAAQPVASHQTPTATNSSKKLVFRSQQQGKYLRRNSLRDQAEPVAPPSGLQDVARYVENLEECWDETVKNLMSAEASVDTCTKQTTVLRDQVRQKTRKIRMLKEIARQNANENIRLTAELSELKQKVAPR
ncbi:hypothetical protein DIPPA_09019 [Diplonema papillatum]|nr:hypothetical protein DIPPA_09019 [Diplonema papillatum]